jgi:hypothetical protein
MIQASGRNQTGSMGHRYLFFRSKAPASPVEKAVQI